MAKNTNPITKKIYGQSSWSTITFHTAGVQKPTADLYHDIFVRKLIHGACLKLNLLTSQIQILKHATGIVEINFMFTPLSLSSTGPSRGLKRPVNNSGMAEEDLSKKIIELKTCIKSILELKFNNIYKFKILQAPHLFSNAKILTDFLEIKLAENPRTHRPLLMRLFNEFKKITAGMYPASKQNKMSLINLTKLYLSSTANQAPDK